MRLIVQKEDDANFMEFLDRNTVVASDKDFSGKSLDFIKADFDHPKGTFIYRGDGHLSEKL